MRGGLVIRVTDTPNPQTFCDLDEHRLVVDIDDLLGRHLGDVQRQPKDVRVGFSKVDKQEEIKKSTNSPSLKV